MTDDRIPRRHIVTLDEAARDAPAQKDKPRSLSSTADFVQKRELVVILTNLTNRINQGVTNATEAVGEAVYDAIAEKTSEMLAQQEHTLRQEFMAEIERRSLRGRWRRFVAWLMSYGMEVGLIEPPALVLHSIEIEAAMEHEEALAKIRAILETATPGQAIELPDGVDEAEVRQLEDEIRAERAAAVDAVTPADEDEDEAEERDGR